MLQYCIGVLRLFTPSLQYISLLISRFVSNKATTSAWPFSAAITFDNNNKWTNILPKHNIYKKMLETKLQHVQEEENAKIQAFTEEIDSVG